MIATHETLLIQTTGAAADALSPGTIQRALCAALRISADALGMMHPLGRGQVGVELALPHALSLSTPMMLTALHEAGKTLITLRRTSDPVEARAVQLRVTWKGQPPTPGQLVRALHQATEERFDAGDLGAVFEGNDWMVATVSEGLYRRLNLPASVTIGKCAMTFQDHSAS